MAKTTEIYLLTVLEARKWQYNFYSEASALGLQAVFQLCETLAFVLSIHAERGGA